MRIKASSGSLLARLRRAAVPVATAQLFLFGYSALAPNIVCAQERREEAFARSISSSGPATEQSSEEAEAYRPTSDELEAALPADRRAPSSAETKERLAEALADGATKSVPASQPQPQQPATGSATETLDLPMGANKSGVSPQSISLPKGAGTINGMGESFSAQLSTGIASLSVPFALPAARGGAQPTLGLSYSSSGGAGLAGMGWDLGVPYIARQTDRGTPRYIDVSGFDADQDRFVFNGGQELVPICQIDGGLQCRRLDGSLATLPGEAMPAWSSGAKYFRARVEGSFLRFFWLQGHQTWRVQNKAGISMELGVPLDGSRRTDGLEVNPDAPTEIYRWHLVRQYDTYGTVNDAALPPAPKNVVSYLFRQDGGRAYLSDIFDTTPAQAATTNEINRYAHHTRLEWQARPDPSESYRSGWKIETTLRLARVDVTSKTMGGETGSRRLVRRYHLAYEGGSHTSLLSSVQIEGRCTGSEGAAPAEDGSQLLPPTACPRLPEMRFGYSHVEPFTTADAVGSSGQDGFEPFDEQIVTVGSSPPHSVDEAHADFFDINSDALPDLLVTAPGKYGNGHGVFYNGADGAADTFGAAVRMAIEGVNGDTGGDIVLSNSNVSPLDLDGDGTIDLLHMPAVKTYSIYSPQNGAWVGRAVPTASAQSPKIDFGTDASRTRLLDVNFDGLVDVVMTTGTEMQTFLSLGRYPQGDGQFGTANWTSASTSDISNDPIRTCLPRTTQAVSFDSREFQPGDMNGDGITDVVRVYRGSIQYWPGRGNGVWGTGPGACAPGDYDRSRHVSMSSSPNFVDIPGSLRVDDVNGDGLDDLVQVRNTAVDVWLNIDGKAWTPRRIIEGTPFNSEAANRVRVLDINGSGTRDLVWGNSGEYRYIDLAGGHRPRLLIRIENGLGKSTDIEYSTSSTEMLAAERRGDACSPDAAPWDSPWCSKMPTVAHVVKRVTERDNLIVAGRTGVQITEYDYRDPVFDGRQREFRGFRKARTKRVGDANSPTDFNESTFLLGECEDETADATDDCSVGERWRDNPKEALKGLPVIAESYDEAGTRLTTELTTYRLRQLYTGLDGRSVRHAFAARTRTYRYDTSEGPVAARTGGAFSAVELELTPDAGFDVELTPLALPAGVDLGLAMAMSFRHYTTSTTAVLESEDVTDFFGNRLVVAAKGCIGGGACPTFDTADDRGLVVDETIFAYTLPGRPSGDSSGWLWRTIKSYAKGSVNTQRRKETTLSYDFRGAPTGGFVALEGTVPLDRFNAVPGNGTAPPPVTRSTGSSIPLPTRFYDELGNLTKSHLVLANSVDRCSTIDYEAVVDGQGANLGYAQFPTLETLYVGDDCSGKALITGASYDRGFGSLTTAIDVALQPSKVDYDGFGRPVATWRPDPGAPALSPQPSSKHEYFLPPDLGGRAYSIVHTSSQDGATPAAADYLETWSFIDGRGRTVATATEADPGMGDAQPYILSGVTSYDARGQVERKYLASFASTAPLGIDLGAVPSSQCGSQQYDAFGRAILTYDVDGGTSCRGTVTLEVRHHALSKDSWDAADREPGGIHHGSFASERVDGHGRPIAVAERIKVSENIEQREVRTQFLPSGEAVVITRVLSDAVLTPSVVRWMAYDTAGRMTVNADPHTSTSFVGPTDALPASAKVWRYLYDDAGNLVATSDARGCGANFGYDGVGRLSMEDYSPCVGHQGAYTEPDFGNISRMEVLHFYDGSTIPNNRPDNFVYESQYNRGSTFLNGRLAATFDRGRAELRTYDGRGRVVRVDKRVSKPQSGDTQGFVTGALYAPTWYTKRLQYDGADREVMMSTGARVAELMGTAGVSEVATSYTRRGKLGSVASTYGGLVRRVMRDADGLVTEIKYDDAAETRTTQGYDRRRRLENLVTERSQPSIWLSPPAQYLPAPALPPAEPTSFQLQLEDTQIVYDAVGNPTSILDHRNADEWPTGGKPVSRVLGYDDLYRLTHTDYLYETADANDTSVSPFSSELAGAVDPRRALPAPHKQLPTRIRTQVYSYDWLGNTTSTDDDLHVSFDRSLGAITNNFATGRPYQLGAATQSANSAHAGGVTTAYDAAGNLLTMGVVRTATGCGGGICSINYDYQWDEIGRLTRARRKEGVVFVADLRFNYDSGDQRTRKSSGAFHSVYVFDSLELRRTAYNSSVPLDFAIGPDTEVPYLNANGIRLGRVVVEQINDGEPRLSGERQHVFLTLADHLGSGNMVIDRATGELVERVTFQPYGATESDYRPDRWKAFREDHKFTGKEEDVEVGLQYFGKRYLSPYLGRWTSADPLAVHSPGAADLNLYAYVHGRVLRNVDPLGLQEYPESEAVASTVDEDGDAAAVTVDGAVVGSGPTVATAGAVADMEYAQTAKRAKETPPAPVSPQLAKAPGAASQLSNPPPVAGGGATSFDEAGYSTTVPNLPEGMPVWIDIGDSRTAAPDVRSSFNFGHVFGVELNISGLGQNYGVQLGGVWDYSQGPGVTFGTSHGESLTWGGKAANFLPSPIQLSASGGISEQIYRGQYESYSSSGMLSGDYESGTGAVHGRVYLGADGTPTAVGTYVGRGAGAGLSINRSTSESTTIFFGNFSGFCY